MNRIQKIKGCLALLLVFAILWTNVSFAENEENKYATQESIAIEYLKKAAENEWLYSENDLTQYFDLESDGGLFAYTRTNVLRKFRNLNAEKRANFLTEYSLEFSGPNEFNILVRLIENISFELDGEFNHFTNTYIISFNENSKIVDVNKVNDWFETAYRHSGKSENIIVSELMKEIVNNMQPDISSLKNVSLFSETENIDNVQYIMYDPTNAANYGLTYSGPTSDYYNDNFDSWAGDGGDCMNFASQAMFAGFNGSNEDYKTLSKATDGPIPLFDNYTINDSYATWHINGGPWLGVNSFYEYISDPKPKDSGLVASVWTISADQWDLGIDVEFLKGAIILTPGESSTETQIYGHAIVVTDAEGSTRDMIHYSGHTTNKHDDILSNRYKNVPLYVVRPIYFKMVHNCLFEGHVFKTFDGLIGGESSNCIWCGYNKLQITNKLLAPVLIGSSQTLGSRVTTNVFKLSIQITTPSNEVVWLRDEYNTNFIKRAYTFTEPGLYKITTYAQDTNDILNIASVETSSSYYVRVLGGNENPSESGEVDDNFINDSFDISFIPNYNVG